MQYKYQTTVLTVVSGRAGSLRAVSAPVGRARPGRASVKHRPVKRRPVEQRPVGGAAVKQPVRGPLAVRAVRLGRPVRRRATGALRLTGRRLRLRLTLVVRERQLLTAGGNSNKPVKKCLSK